MTPREAAIVSAYTGYLIGDFSVMHAYIEEKMGRPVFTHEMGNDMFMKELQQEAKSDFISINIEE